LENQKVRYRFEDLGTDARIILKRQVVYYVQQNFEVHSGNHCCRGRATSIIYFEGVSVALGIISFTPIPWIFAGLQNPYGYGNSHYRT
jgi:hypothetical protein